MKTKAKSKKATKAIPAKATPKVAAPAAPAKVESTAPVAAAAPAQPPAEPTKTPAQIVADRIAKIQADAEAEAAAKKKADEAKVDLTKLPPTVINSVKATAKAINSAEHARKHGSAALRDEVAKMQAKSDTTAQAAWKEHAKPLPSPSGITKQGHDGNVIEHRPNGSAPKALPAPAKPVVIEDADELSGWLPLSVPALSAALLIAPKEGKEARFYLCGAFLHRTDLGDVRLIATDGHRLLAQTLEVDPKEAAAHKWLDQGVIIPRFLLERCNAIPKPGKNEGQAEAFLQFDTNKKRITLRDKFNEVILRGAAVEAKYPDYQRVVTDAGAALVSAEREPGEASCFESKYVAEAHKIASHFGVTQIAAYPGDGKSASIITFPRFPSALYIVMPIRADGTTLQAETARIIGAPGLSRTLAALKAHATRHVQAAKEAKDDKVKAREQAEAERFKARIAALMGAHEKALAAPEPKADAKQIEKPADKTGAVGKVVMAPLGIKGFGTTTLN